MLSARRFAIKKKNLIGYRYVPKELVFKNHWGYLVFSVDNHNLTFYKILYASMLWEIASRFCDSNETQKQR